MTPHATKAETQSSRSQIRARRERRERHSSRGVLGSLVSATISWFSRKPSELDVPRRLGRYELDRKIGEGGMGVVYSARDARNGRPVAVKLQRAERRGGEARARFEREIRLTSGLSHPNIVSAREHGETPDGVAYFTMDLLEGATLEDVVERSGPLPVERVVHVLCAVASALVEIHEKGLVHRDIKPSNVFLCALDGAVKLLDFGLVKDLTDLEAESEESGKVLGTPHYLAPESIAAPEKICARTDLYAVGALAYFLLTGEAPFGGASVVEVCCHHLHSPVIPPSRLAGEIPEALEALVMACLEKDPQARPASAAELCERLARIDASSLRLAS